MSIKVVNAIYGNRNLNFESKAIKSIKLNRKGLIINFNRNRNSYIYKDVPMEIIIGFLKADSKGQFYNTEIKGKYDFEVKESKVSGATSR